jgi:hypothetical protein
LKIAFPLNDAKDIDFIRRSFDLNDEQAAFLFKLPPFGQAIIRYGGYEKPFLLAVPDFQITASISQQEIEQRMSGFYADLKEKIQPAPASKQQRPGTDIPPQAAALLYFLSKNPFTKTSEMTSAPGFKSPADVLKALAFLEVNDFIVRESHRVSKRGRKSTFAVLSEKALRYLNVQPAKGKGSFEHRLYQHLIEKKLKARGERSIVESRINDSNKACDVLSQTPKGGIVAYEICLHFQNLGANIRQDIEAGADLVVVVTKDRAELQKARGLFYGNESLSHYSERVRFCSVEEFFAK